MVTPKPKGEKGGFIMKKLAKVGAVVLGVIVVAGIAASSSETEEKNIEVVAQTTSPESTKTTEVTTKETEQPKEQSVEIFNKKGIVIIAKGLSEELFDKGINLEAKNNSKKDVIVEIEDVSVDGVMVNTFYYEDIKKGKLSKETLNIYLDEGELSEVSEIEFTIKVTNAKTYDTILEETKTLTLK